MAAIMAAALLLAGAGCGDASPFLGEWRGRYEVPVVPGQDPAIRETLANLRVEVRRDGTCSVREEGFVKEGSWRMGREGLELDLRSSLGRPLEGDMGGRRTLRRTSAGLEYVRPGHETVALSRAG